MRFFQNQCQNDTYSSFQRLRNKYVILTSCICFGMAALSEVMIYPASIDLCGFCMRTLPGRMTDECAQGFSKLYKWGFLQIGLVEMNAIEQKVMSVWRKHTVCCNVYQMNF